MITDQSNLEQEVNPDEDNDERNRRELRNYLNAGGNEEDYNQFKVRARNQKLSLVFVSVVGVTMLTLGFFQLRNILEVPFPSSGKEKAVISSTNTEPTSLYSLDDEQLKVQDTDEDGMSDFDEIYIYKTSPYLADTDSDGKTDYEEVKSQTDPNCQEGQVCFLSSSQTLVDTSVGSTVSAGVVTPAIVRALLLKTGSFTEDQLSGLSDEDVMAVYDEVVGSDPALKQKLEEAIGGSANVGTATVVDPANVSIAQIKAMFMEIGMTEEELSALDDATLRQVYDEALQSTEEKIDEVKSNKK